jgi:hypothetical protein
MRLSEKDRQLFQAWTKHHLLKNRSTTSSEIFKALAKDEPGLLKRITKASKKIGPIAYIGRYLLPKFKKDGWLIYENNLWKVNINQGCCAQCLKPLDEVYFIMGKIHFCNDDCADDFDWDSEEFVEVEPY